MMPTFDQALTIEKLVAMVDNYRRHVPHCRRTAADVVRMIRDEELPPELSDDRALILRAKYIIESFLGFEISYPSMDALLYAMTELETTANE